jgi:hypothetical protein
MVVKACRCAEFAGNESCDSDDGYSAASVDQASAIN